MKNCIECGEEKPLTAFYAHPKTADLRSGVCKECHKSRMRRRQAENPAVRAYDRGRAMEPGRVILRARVTAQWRIDNPQAYKAQTAVGNALRDGKIVKGACHCGATEVHGHHADYSKPLEVEWLCPLHHHRYHASARA